MNISPSIFPRDVGGGVNPTGKALHDSSRFTESSTAEHQSVPDDSTQLSHAAILLHHAMELPEVESGKVECIRQSVASGSYEVSASDVARSMVRDFKESHGVIE